MKESKTQRERPPPWYKTKAAEQKSQAGNIADKRKQMGDVGGGGGPEQSRQVNYLEHMD